MMNILRAEHSAEYPYVMMSKATANNGKLSLAARGLLAWLLDKPDTWEIDPDATARLNSTTLHEIKKLLKELAQHNYLIPPKRITVKGRFQYTPYTLRETPDIEALPCDENREAETVERKPLNGNRAPVFDSQSRTGDKHEPPSEQITKINKYSKQEKQENTTTLPVANSEQVAPDAEKPGSGGVYTLPVLDSIDLWEFNARTLPAEIEPPAHSFDFKAKASEVKPPAQSKPADSDVSSTPPPVPSRPLPEPVPDTGLADCIRAYEANIGLIVPMIADAIKGALQDYPAAWITDAIEIAVEQNVRKWSYVVGILEKWRVRGKQPTPVKFMAATPVKPADDYDPFNRDASPPEAAPTAEPVDPVWSELDMRVQVMALSQELYDTFKKCKFGGVKDGVLTVVCPTDAVFKACYRMLRHQRWLYRQAESLWDGLTDVEFVLEGDTDALPETP